MFKVVCIDATNRPQEVPTSCWLKEGQEYTVLRISRNKITNEDYFILQEVQPTPPYGGYKVDRFVSPHIDSLEAQYELQAIK